MLSVPMNGFKPTPSCLWINGAKPCATGYVLIGETVKEKDGATKGNKQAFVWTDEVELLLKVTHGYKVKKAGENVDWELVRLKYSDIWEQLEWQLPSDSEKAMEMGKNFPHKKQALTTKAVWRKYR